MRPYFPMLICVIGAGCASSHGVIAPRGESFDMRPGVQKEFEGELMFVSSTGRKVGFSAREIVEIAESYIDSHGLRPSITKDTPRIWVDTTGGKRLASVYYEGARKWDILYIEIDKDGEVFRHTLAPTVCGGVHE